MGDGKDIQIGNKVIGESTKITLTVKTALWILGLLIALFGGAFTIAYFDVKSDVKSYKEKIDAEKQEFVKKVQDDITNKLEKRRDKEEEFVRSIEEIKGNIKLLLDRTQRVSPSVGDGVNTIRNTSIPSDTPPPINH